jgi:REP element-mobilizing transposase RayT
MQMPYYERNLPHWHPEGAAIFLTWRLHGTYAHLRPDPTSANPGRVFAAADRQLDRAVSGPKWLREPAIAQSLVDALRFGEQQLRLYSLIAFCVMPNHVHAVVQPRVPVYRITKSIKGFTARRANVLLGRTGEPFWQDETYDHWIRTDSELQRVIRYTERNPVVAGLVESPEQWPWSSASKNTGRNACATASEPIARAELNDARVARRADDAEIG